MSGRISFSILLFSLLIFSCSNNNSEKKVENTGPVTFAEHISPIIFKNCTPCHRTGEAGPFTLLNYADAKKNANKIKFVTKTGYMPPWPADTSYSHFIGERVLSANEIELIQKWVEGSCLPGDTTKVKAPEFYTGSFFGKPDVVISMKEVVPIKGNGTDHFYMVKMPYELKKDTFVRIIEFVPHQRKLAHHVNGHTVSYEEGKKKNVYEGKSYWLDIPGGSPDVFKEMGLANDDGTFPVLTPNTVYYLPGYTPQVYPQNIGGYKLNKKGAFFLKNLHYGPSKSNCVDSSKINLFFGPKPVRPIQETQLGTFGIAPIEPKFDIPANTVKTFMSKWTTPGDMSILSVNPHMHLLGTKFWAYALTPNGDTIKLVRINKWNFNWQYYYTFKHPVKIPAGSTIFAFGTYDNTVKNPFNPFTPPRDCKERNDLYSMGTTEEMFQFIFTYLPYQPGDEKMDMDGKN
ncbi:MAG: monooxygenase [Bacteroidia bacterium]